ncbi:MAG: type II secretion system minor pseudopilin GspH [Gammaproteobacteria bacterium]|nr:type II secretion system minor pseudopilin GspH [Gammaproteobacteria bacterium]
MTSATGICSKTTGFRTNSGFTLMELLVALLIIGVMVTFAGLSLRGDPWAERMHEETRRLAALLELAAENALLESRELAVRFEPDGYHFLRLQEGQWRELAEGVLRPRTLPPGMELELRLQEGGPILVGDDGEDQERAAPQVYILSSGEMTPFTLRLGALERDYRYELRADLLGRLEWEGPL